MQNRTQLIGFAEQPNATLVIFLGKVSWLNEAKKT